MAFDSIVRDIATPDYIKFALFSHSSNELDIEPKQPDLSYPDIDNGKEVKSKQLKSTEEIIELRKHGIVTRGPKSEAQGYIPDSEKSLKQLLQERKEFLNTAPVIRDPKNWFDFSPQGHKSIVEQIRENGKCKWRSE